MKEIGINLYNAGGETADVGSYTTTVGIDVTASAVIQKDRIVDCSNIGPDEYIVGLASYGQSTYETRENSGIRSNGLTLAINTLLNPYYRKYKETMDGTIAEKDLFCGKYYLTDKLEGSTLTVAEAILSPTRTYLPVIRDILLDGVNVSGIIHCSGGGLTKSVNFGENITYVKDGLLDLEVPPIFREIQNIRNIDNRYMYQTFNMGIGMEIVVKSLSDANLVRIHARRYGIPAFIIGRTEASKTGKNTVQIGPYTYTK